MLPCLRWYLHTKVFAARVAWPLQSCTNAFFKLELKTDPASVVILQLHPSDKSSQHCIPHFLRPINHDQKRKANQSTKSDDFFMKNFQIFPDAFCVMSCSYISSNGQWRSTRWANGFLTNNVYIRHLQVILPTPPISGSKSRNIFQFAWNWSGSILVLARTIGVTSVQ